MSGGCIGNGSNAVRWAICWARTSTWCRRTNLYRCLDKLLAHKTELFSFLQQRWKTLFEAEFEVLLYDLTSTYFECDPPGRPAKRRHGYSRDKRSDCVAGRDRFDRDAGWLAAGLRGDGLATPRTKRRCARFLQRIEAQYGKAGRTWVMDRGIPTEAVLAEMRAAETRDRITWSARHAGGISQMREGLPGQPWAAGARRGTGEAG